MNKIITFLMAALFAVAASAQPAEVAQAVQSPSAATPLLTPENMYTLK